MPFKKSPCVFWIICFRQARKSLGKTIKINPECYDDTRGQGGGSVQGKDTEQSSKVEVTELADGLNVRSEIRGTIRGYSAYK